MQSTQTNKIITYHFAADFMSDYLWIGVGRVGSSTENITQKLLRTKSKSKTQPLLDALNEIDGMTIVFAAKKKTAVSDLRG